MRLSSFHDYRNSLEDRLTDILRPELDDDRCDNVTVLFASEIDLPISQTTGGLTGQSLISLPEVLDALYVRQRSTNGPIIVFNDAHSDHGRAFGSRLELNSVAAHEIAHVACFPSLAPLPTDNPAMVSIVTENYSSMEDKQPSQQPQAWFGHGLDWLSALLAIRERLRCRGAGVDLPLAGNFAEYGYSPAEVYLEALGTHATDNIDLPLRAALSLPAPMPFVRRWLSDIGMPDTHQLERN